MRTQGLQSRRLPIEHTREGNEDEDSQLAYGPCDYSNGGDDAHSVLRRGHSPRVGKVGREEHEIVLVACNLSNSMLNCCV